MSKKQLHRFLVFSVGGLSLVLLLSGCDLLFGTSDSSGSDSAGTDYSSVSTILGRGYDVFDKYANPEYIKSSILDFEALRSAGLIERTSLENTNYDTLSGTNSESYQTDMGATADLQGSLRFFSGSLGGSFSSTTYSDSSNQYATINVRVRKDLYAIRNRSNVTVLRQYLNPEFSANLHDTDYVIDDLFDNYGTHVMTGVIMGARYDYNLAAQTTAKNTGQTITAYAQTSFANTFGSAASSSNYTFNQDTYDAFSESESSVTGVGGNSALVASENGLNSWIDSINSSTVVFSDYAASDGLIPIWELCADTTRAAAIKAAYANWEETKYDDYVKPGAPTATTGKLRFTLVSFKNINVMDGLSGDAEWLWQVRVFSYLDGNTRKLSSRINWENSKQVGQGETHYLGYYTTYWNVPLSGGHNFRIRPYLEEEDGKDLGYNDNEFCDNDGPYIDFKSTTNGEIKFDGITNSNGTQGWFTTSSGQTGSNDSMTLEDGDDPKYFYIVMKEKGSSNDDKCQFKFKVEWDHND